MALPGSLAFRDDSLEQNGNDIGLLTLEPARQGSNQQLEREHGSTFGVCSIPADLLVRHYVSLLKTPFSLRLLMWWPNAGQAATT